MLGIFARADIALNDAFELKSLDVESKGVWSAIDGNLRRIKADGRFNVSMAQQDFMMLFYESLRFGSNDYTHQDAKTRWVIQPVGCCRQAVVTHKIPVQCCSALSLQTVNPRIAHAVWHQNHFAPMCACSTCRAPTRSEMRAATTIKKLLSMKVDYILDFFERSEVIAIADSLSRFECTFHSPSVSLKLKADALFADLQRFCCRHEQWVRFIQSFLAETEDKMSKVLLHLSVTNVRELWRTKIEFSNPRDSKSARFSLQREHEDAHRMYKENWQELIAFFDHHDSYIANLYKSSSIRIGDYDHSYTSGVFDGKIIGILAVCSEEDCDVFQKRQSTSLPVVHIMSCNPLQYKCDSSLNFWFRIERWANIHRYKFIWWGDEDRIGAQPLEFEYEFSCDED